MHINIEFVTCKLNMQYLLIQEELLDRKNLRNTSILLIKIIIFHYKKIKSDQILKFEIGDKT